MNSINGKQKKKTLQAISIKFNRMEPNETSNQYWVANKIRCLTQVGLFWRIFQRYSFTEGTADIRHGPICSVRQITREKKAESFIVQYQSPISHELGHTQENAWCRSALVMFHVSDIFVCIFTLFCAPLRSTRLSAPGYVPLIDEGTGRGSVTHCLKRIYKCYAVAAAAAAAAAQLRPESGSSKNKFDRRLGHVRVDATTSQRTSFSRRNSVDDFLSCSSERAGWPALKTVVLAFDLLMAPVRHVLTPYGSLNRNLVDFYRQAHQSASSELFRNADW